MEYKEFLDYIKSSINQIIGKEKNVKILKVLKTNDIEYDALTITDSHTNVSPTIYLNQYYIDYLNKKPLGQIINEIYGLYEEHSKNIELDIEIFTDFQKAKKRIAYKVINAGQNENLLKDCPHIRKLDLALVFYCIIDNDYLGSATSLIHYNHLDMWGISAEELTGTAIENAPAILKPELRDMNDIIYEMLKNDLHKQQINGELPIDVPINEELDRIMKSMKNQSPIEMYVLTNSLKQYGASCMFYQNVLKKFSDNYNRDIYILPSSVHEVILVPVSEDINIHHLNHMVKEVNRQDVDNCEILSDHVYIYKRDKDEIIM